MPAQSTTSTHKHCQTPLNISDDRYRRRTTLERRSYTSFHVALGISLRIRFVFRPFGSPTLPFAKLPQHQLLPSNKHINTATARFATQHTVSMSSRIVSIAIPKRPVTRSAAVIAARHCNSPQVATLNNGITKSPTQVLYWPTLAFVKMLN